MELLPIRRFNDLDTLRCEMDQLWDQFLNNPLSLQTSMAGKLPVIDIIEEADKIIIKADLPGMEKKDISVTLADDMLTIKGERSSEKEEKKKNYFRQERHFGKFQRTFRLPGEIKSEKVDAVFDKGVLQITLQKSEAQKNKEITINIK